MLNEQAVNFMQKMEISDWGNYPVLEAETVKFKTTDQLKGILNNPGDVIAYGNGRSYGDASLQERVIMTKSFNSFVSFDQEKGIICCEAGVLLSDILEAFVPRGWFLPVSPGTKYITVGGAVAADIHGKNHHIEGSFGSHVLSLDVMRANGEMIHCSPEINKEFFALTVGGMGLSGMIINITFKMKPIESSWIKQQYKKTSSISELMDEFESDDQWNYSVAWIDMLKTGKSLGRGILLRGQHAKAEEINHGLNYSKSRSTNINLNYYMPNRFLNRSVIKAFNSIYYNRNIKGYHEKMVHYESFFYPLDNLGNWNRLYGRRGFMQYQFVIPFSAGRKPLEMILKKIESSRYGSFLAVLKLFGEQESFISFPMKGYTLALDFPVCFEVFKLMKELDSVVADFGGRLYLAKDARMDSKMFEKTYPFADDFREAISILNDGSTRFSSLLSKRIGLT